jgi:hypothetical protein
MSITEIVAKIDQRLGELEAELAHLTGARAALVGGTAPVAVAKPRAAAAKPRAATATPSAAATPARARRQSRKRSYDVVPVGKLISLLTGSPGMRTRELARASNGDPKLVLALLKEQGDAGGNTLARDHRRGPDRRAGRRASCQQSPGPRS